MGLRSSLGLLCLASCIWVLKAEEGVLERRAPAMGFMGMRGKKDYDEKRAPSSMGFAAMRGKKDPFFDFSDIYPDYKRAPQMGFMGMRGKKDFESDYELDFPFDKRVPANMGFAAMKGKKAPSGFMGMRGKKFDYTDDDFIEDDVWPLEEFEKRGPTSGFYGTRGKKMPQNSAFYGMRGKKGPSGFVGMRGKKAPSAGFMGVRGKKDGADDLESLLALLNERQGDRSKRDDSALHTDSSANSQAEAQSLDHTSK